MIWPHAVSAWGSTAPERAAHYDCDALVPAADHALFRAIDVAAPAAVTFRWLCQLRAAPYSYDKLDNLGRRSPQWLTPGLERLEAGQRVQTIFRLTTFEDGRSLTMLSSGRLFGRVGLSYVASPVGPQRSRIVAKIVVRYRRTPPGALMRAILPPGDLVMMRRQLLNLRGLAEAAATQGA